MIKYPEVPQSTQKYLYVHRSTSKYLDVPLCTQKYLNVLRSMSKYAKVSQRLVFGHFCNWRAKFKFTTKNLRWIFLQKINIYAHIPKMTLQESPRSLKSGPTAPMGGGPKEFGGTKAFKPLVQRGVIVSFGPPKIIVLSLKFHHLSSPQNNCSVPSNSVSSRPPKSFVVPPK